MNSVNTDIEKKWLKFLKQQRFEAKIQAKFSKFKRFEDIDPRHFIRPFHKKKIFKGVLNILKFIAYETLYGIFSVTIGKKCKLNKPIFIVGLPHSGTTIFMKLVARHPDISNSSELNTYWHPNNYLDVVNSEHVKTEKDCSEKVKIRLTKRLCFEKMIHGNKPRFLNKNPNNTVTVEFIKKCFPDAFIIHIVRDGRSVVNSLVNSMPEVEIYDRYKKPENRVSPFPGVKPKNWRDLLDENPILQHAKQWQACINHIHKCKDKLAPQFLEITYEELCSNTKDTVKKVWEFAELNVNERILNQIPEKLESRNYKYKQRMSEKDIEDVTKLLKKELTELNYIN